MSSAATQPAAAPAAERGAFTPIGEDGLLAACNSAALVNRDGSIDWLCLPRYDSDAIFARILDPDGGHWSLRPAGEYPAERRDVSGSLVIETTFTTPGGVVRMRDAMAFAPGQRGHDLGHDAPHEVLRSVEGVSGSVELVMELVPRPEYGLVRPLIRIVDGGAKTFGGPNRIEVASSAPLELRDAGMHASFAVNEGQRLGFAIAWMSPEHRDPPRPTAPPAAAAAARRRRGAGRRRRRRMAVLGGRARRLRRAAPRPRAPLRPRAQGPDVPPDRRGRRRPHDIAAGDGRRRAQLGLSLLVDPRLEPHPRGPLHRRMHRRGGGVRLVHDECRGRRRVVADHVRHRRRA